jgi:aspartate-semialdehyde dehydrogenase
VSDGYRVGIAGATGVVGEQLLALLEGGDVPVGSLRLLASGRSAGRRIRWQGKEHEVHELSAETVRGLDVVFFSCGAERSRAFAPAAVEAGAVVIDNSSAFRMRDDVPLVVPELNPDAVDGHAGIVAVPNCTTIVFLMAAGPLHREARLRRAVLSSYQAASGAGRAALDEWRAQMRADAAGRDVPASNVFPRRLHANVIPHVDVFLDDGSTREERKCAEETRKILGDDEIAVAATCVRVPVERAHAVSASLAFERPLAPDRARRVLAAAPGVRVVDGGLDGAGGPDYPTPLEASGSLDVHVGRIRPDPTSEGGLMLWAVGDQLLKGAAWNAVQIAELLIQRGGL